MRQLCCLALLVVLGLLVASCRPPAYLQAYPDAHDAGPFWERDNQHD